MSVEKAALVVALAEIKKAKKRLDAIVKGAVTHKDVREAVSGLAELRATVVDMRSEKHPPTIAKGKSRITKEWHLILVYTDGSEEDVGEIARPATVVRQMIGGGSSGLDRQQVIQLIEETVATSPVSSGYRIADEDSGLAVKYYGYMDSDGNWYVMKADHSVDPQTYRYSGGDSGYPAAWTDRENLVYGLYSELGT